MKYECPYCHNEMTEGRIEAHIGEICFATPEQHCYNAEVKLAKTRLKNATVNAHICIIAKK